MAFASMDSDDGSDALAEINMVPLIDVMLVLLIIFMVTAPLLTHAVKVDLPKAASSANESRAEHVQLAIDASGSVFWNGDPIAPEALGTALTATARQTPQPELHLHAERTTPYERVAQVMSQAAQAGLSRIGFVTNPGNTPR